MSASDVRRFLERHGLAANRDLGQNFLVDDTVASHLVDLAGVESSDGVLEIGTGLGILTRALAGRAARVTTLEIDAGVVRALRSDSMLPENVTLFHADALTANLAEHAATTAERVRLVANLPYSVSGPLLRRLLDLRGVLVDWSVLLQREVAARLLAAPGTRDYGSLAVLHALTVDVSRETDLSPRCFFPVPKVRSTFVRIRPRAAPLVAVEELVEVEVCVRAAFSKRRKTLANAMRECIGGDSAAAIAACGIDPRLRAQQLEPDAFVALARGLRARGTVLNHG